jgi:hypothetical protein
MNVNEVSIPAIVAAACSMFVIGGLWYSPLLFGGAWMRVNGFTEAQVSGFSKTRSFGGSAVLSLVMATNLAIFLADSETTLTWGMIAGGLAGAGWVACGVGMVALFEGRSWSYIAINAGYQVVAFLVMGAILGGWR